MSRILIAAILAFVLMLVRANISMGIDNVNGSVTVAGEPSMTEFGHGGAVGPLSNTQGGSGFASWGVDTSSAFFNVSVSPPGTSASSVTIQLDQPWTGPSGIVQYAVESFIVGNPVISEVDWEGNPPSGGIFVATGDSISVRIIESLTSSRYAENQDAIGVVSWGLKGQPMPGDDALHPKTGILLASGLGSLNKRNTTTNYDPCPGCSVDCTSDKCGVDGNDEQIAGAMLTAMPVKADRGVTQAAYFGPSQAKTPNVYSPTDYFFGSESNLKFTSFVAPNGIQGDTSHIMIDDGTSLIPYVPGTTYTFSNPVLTFALRGLDKSVMPPDDTEAPFVWGATFDQEGAAIVYQGTYSVPTYPGDFNRDGVVDGADYLFWRKYNGTASDYATWQSNFGQVYDASGATRNQQAIPEPCTILLLLSGVTIQVIIVQNRRGTVALPALFLNRH